MKTLYGVLAVAISLCAGPALAHDRSPDRNSNSYWDFRFGFGGEPALKDAHYEPAGGGVFDANWDAKGGSFEFNASHRFSARGPHSAFVSMGAFARGFSGDDDPPTGTQIDLGAVGIQGGGGYSFWDGGAYSLEFGPEVGLGVAHAEEQYPPYGDAIEGDGGYAKFSVQVRNIWTFTRFQLGFTIGAGGWAAATTYDPQYIDVGGGPTYFAGGDVEYKGSGVFGNVFMGWR